MSDVNIIILPQTCQFRLSLESGVPVSTSDQTGAGAVYAEPTGGNTIALYTGSAWVYRQSAAFSLALSSLTPFRTYDVFAYDNAGTPTLEFLGWTAPSTGSITGATNATPISITSTSHGLSTNQTVYISGVGGNTAANSATGVPFRVTNTGANTFTLQTLAGANVAGSGSYTSGGTWFRADQSTARATALTRQNGVLVKSGDATRRYMGSFVTTSAATTEDAVARRFLWSLDNQVTKPLRKIETTSSWTYSLATERATNNNLGNRVEVVQGFAQSALFLMVRGKHQTDTLGDMFARIGEDSVTTAASELLGGTIPLSVASVYNAQVALLSKMPTAGYHYYQWLERTSGSGTQTHFGQSESGLAGNWQC